MSASRYKRSDFANEQVRRYFIMFFCFTLFVVAFFITEDFQSSIQDELFYSTLSHTDSTTEALPTYLLKPLNLALLLGWAVASGFFVWAFNRRIQSLLYLFLTLSILVLLIHFFWNSLVQAGINNNHQFFVRAAQQMDTGGASLFTYKTILLIFWSCFSLFLSFSIITAKYLGVFARLDYLFLSINHGNWDANMFFRNEDSFSFVAKSFNQLKNKYLDELYAMDDQLILAKDNLAEAPFNEQTRQTLLQALQGNTESEK